MKNKIIFFLFCIFLNKVAVAQITVGYFPFQNVLNISSNPEKLIWIDGRLQTNTFIGNISPEFFGLINLKRTSLVNYYAGLGTMINTIDNSNNFISGYSLTIGTRIKPFEKFPNFSFVFEVSPYVNKDLKVVGGLFRAFLGISYRIGK